MITYAATCLPLKHWKYLLLIYFYYGKPYNKAHNNYLGEAN